MEGIFVGEEIDSLSNVLERDHFNRCRRERMTPRNSASDNVRTIIIGLWRDHVRIEQSQL